MIQVDVYICVIYTNKTNFQFFSYYTSVTPELKFNENSFIKIRGSHNRNKAQHFCFEICYSNETMESPNNLLPDFIKFLK